MKNTVKIFSTVYGVLLSASCLTQTPKAYENAAENAVATRDYYTAMQYYGKVLEMEPNRLDVSYRYADAARKFGAFSQAETFFEKTMQADQANQFPDVSYQLADVKKQLGKYDEAIQLYDRYNAEPAADAPMKKKASSAREQCEWAKEKFAFPDRTVKVEQVSEYGFNTPESDFGAFILNDKVYFSSFRYANRSDDHLPTRPVICIMQAKEGCSPEPSKFNDPARHTAHPAFSPDGNILIFNKCDYTGATDIDCQLYISRKSGDEWSDPELLPEQINVPGFKATEPNVTPTSDGAFCLYYASDAPGTIGGLDLWRVRFTDNGKFGTPENLTDINTDGDEVTPFFDPRTNILYFSTKGRWTLGGYDIYKSRLVQGKFREPEHLNVPFNSSFDDLYYTVQREDYAYLTSNRNGAMKLEDACCYDIFKIEFLPLDLTANAFSRTNGKPVDQVLFTLQEVMDEDPDSRFSGDKNSTDFTILRQRKYRLVAQKEFYWPDTVYVVTDVVPQSLHLSEDLHLMPQIQLKVKTFHQWTKEPLTGVKIRLWEIDPREEISKETGKESNESKMDVTGKRQFTIIAEKDGFQSDTITVNEQELNELSAGETLTRNLFLTPASMTAYLPITLYFDNDRPDPRTRATSTLLSYEQTVFQYIAKRQAFIDTYTAGLPDAEKLQAAEKLGRFFDQDVQGGETRLETFAENLGLFLAGGESLEILVKAFASPLANPAYNMALTQRRVASVRNYFRKFNNGIFEPYILNGQLKISILPLGESNADPSVSDDAGNKRLSIYSVEASKERRAEILEVRVFKN